ncbi:cell division protein ZapE [Histidinibacterium aquaticum]|uniref:AFG1 family ATPase n=1 Tax=Histidinibacterium aquaticum TaxID=2613962 RepID=A0A5J5GD94_9RHOB|nr:cell division protein ZapE [Histidinibacterium aquaticum]KAA9006145.1 AFG1 family ATPase [Histidinibacterium aquaticum]
MSVEQAYQRRVEAGGLSPDPEQEAVLPELERIRRELSEPVKKRGFFRRAEPEPIKGLYLWGGVGRGKSMLMDLLVEEVEVPCERRHFHSFMQDIHAGMNEARKRGVDDAIKPVAEEIAGRLRLLAFDEMQISDIADAMIVGRLFERLFEGGVTVVTTSNRPPEDLYKDGLNRNLFVPFIELMQERCTVMQLDSDRDHRQGKLKGTQTYFSPNDAEAREALRDVWERLTDGAEGERLSLKVKGREVEIPAFHNGVAWARFYDLCGRPLGAADYLALAEAARVVLIEDIPRLSRANFNEARRFVTLIDALYEAKVRLFCSAAASPELLYVEGEGSFEFERTASRLIEMQSETWGLRETE